MAISNPGGLLNSVPAPQKQTLATNYLDLANSSNAGWSQQYVPDLMEQEAEVFGPRTISGFLAQVGAEEAMQADQVVWSEQGRLHLSYKGLVTNSTGANAGAGSSATNTITVTTDIDGLTPDKHGVRVNDTVIIANSNGVHKCLVTGVTGDLTFEVLAYDLGAGGLTDTTDTTGTTILVYGSEYGKATRYMDGGTATTQSDSRGANEPVFKTFQNKPIIMKDYYEVSGSDVSRIGWVEISTEMGQSGYMWYLKAESDTRSRFSDYIEMAMLEAEKNVTGTSVIDGSTVMANSASDLVGTEGLFAAIENRGNITTGVTGVNAATDLAEFDAILAEFDSQGAIEEYMMFVNRSTSLAMDDMLASMNSYGAGGTSYGVFDNDENMALNLGFAGFRRGSYDFYKSDMRYLNDKATRGGINAAAGANAIRGVMVPAGTSTVYDQMVGSNMKRPFLHVRYRASQTDDRRMKSWVTGSVGAATSALDAMQLHFLTERCLITQGANNFMLMK
jgi:hypothetical protein